MSRTYSTEGINLKASNLGETDRILTVLTPDRGLVRVIAPGSRKHRNSLTGRSGLFVINKLLIAKGKSLDRISQADTRYSFPALSKDLGKLTAAQYLAEVVLCQAIENEPQPDLYNLLRAHLERLEKADSTEVLAALCQALFHLLALEGVAPQVYSCCATQVQITAPLADPQWRAKFHSSRGGIIPPLPPAPPAPVQQELIASSNGPESGNQVDVEASADGPARVAEPTATYPSDPHRGPQPLNLTALEVTLFQQLTQPELPNLGQLLSQTARAMSSRHQTDGIPYRSPWPRIEQALRQYIQYHFDRSIRSAALIDSTLGQTPPPSTPAVAAP